MTRHAQPEHAMQCALFEWARHPLTLKKHPELALLEGSLNGVKLTILQAVKAKKAGMLKGSHDVRLPVARGGYIGLSIELKVGKNKPTPEQKEIGEMLSNEGWLVLYFWDDWTKVRDAIVDYLNSRLSVVSD